MAGTTPRSIAARGRCCGDSAASLRDSSPAGLEGDGIEAVALEQRAEIAAAALGELRRLGDVAVGDPQHAGQVLALELAARLVEGREVVPRRGQRALQQRRR